MLCSGEKCEADHRDYGRPIARRLLLAVGILWAASFAPLSAQIRLELETSTFVGAEGFDRAQAAITDADGNIYISMNTRSNNLPTTPGVIGPNATGGGDAYFAKYSPDGKELLWATYMGGPNEDRGYGMQFGPDGSVYAVGITKSKQFPTTPGVLGQTHRGDVDFFVARFSSDGDLMFSTLVGGSGWDWSRGNFFVDDQGSVFIGGETDSRNFPVTDNAFQKNLGGGIDGFVVKISSDGTSLDYATYFGGDGRDASYSGMYVSPVDQSIYFAGMTNSSNFPTTPNAYQTEYAGGEFGGELGDAYVARLAADGESLVFSTLIGGPGNDGVAKNDGMVVDDQGRVIVIGQAGAGFPVTPGASQSEFGGGETDGFVSIISSDGSKLVSSTLIGGNQLEEPSGIDIDSLGNVYLSGNTRSTDFPTTPGAFSRQYSGGQTDMILSVLSPDLSETLYSSLLGGSGTGRFGDRGRSLQLVDDHLLVLSGDTDSSDFPTMNAGQPEFAGVADGAVLEWSVLLSGDANGDFVFNSSDLIQVFAAGQYEDSVLGNSSWSSGDWNYDGDFTSGDLILALQSNIYDSGDGATAAIPEPSAGLLFGTALTALFCLRNLRFKTSVMTRPISSVA